MTDYAELHCHSAFSFLDGASMPEALVKEAARLGIEALAITDHNGLYGAVRFARAAKEAGVSTIFGAEVTLGQDTKRQAHPDPPGEHLVVLAKNPSGYQQLSEVLSRGHLEGATKGSFCLGLMELAAANHGNWVILSGCRKSSVNRALVEKGPKAALRELDRLSSYFGKENLAVELWDWGGPEDQARNDWLAAMAAERGLLAVASSNAHYARPEDYPLACVLAATRAQRSLEEISSWMHPSPAAHLYAPKEQLRRFRRYPGAVENAAQVARAISFELNLVAPNLPPFELASQESEHQYLCRLVEEAATRRYGPRTDPQAERAWAQIDHELEVIGALGYSGYFLVVWDIVQFCNARGIFCQGRGSAANSAVCYVLGITKADAVSLGLLFERFLSSERESPPDIDLDIESSRREEVIQYVYTKYDREKVAQVAEVITYKKKSAIRDCARALGYAPRDIDRWTKLIDRSDKLQTREQKGSGFSPIPKEVFALASQMEGLPRHLGIHVGGMVICDRPISQVCPVEWAAMPGRSIIQWDKDDSASIGLVKFDLLGLGMLEALHRMVNLVEQFYGTKLDLSRLPQEPHVYEMIARADTVGVFQVESRAQMSMLPRLRPECFYDLVVAVALIRPGPIQGGSVHPYLKRRRGEEPVSYPHPLAKRCLERTLGVPLFQEQLMQLAMEVAGFSAAEADQLRQAMSSKRSFARIEALRRRLFQGMAERGVSERDADQIYEKILGFGAFGFPESHAISFAYLVYTSAWLKLHYPAAFYAGLLNSQPMGFWSPATLIADAKRHAVEVLPPDVNSSLEETTLEVVRCGFGLRLGLGMIKGLKRQSIQAILSHRPYASVSELASRSGIARSQLELLAAAGATASCGEGNRRDHLWAAAGAHEVTFRLARSIDTAPPPRFPEPSLKEVTVLDLETKGAWTAVHPLSLIRPDLKRRGAVCSMDIPNLPDGTKVMVAGLVTHRQRPETARGITFLNLEDESGFVNVVCSRGLWIRYGQVAKLSCLVLVEGRLQAGGNSFSVLAERLEPLEEPFRVESRDFR